LKEKKINLKKTKCFLLSNKTQYIHNDTWKALKIKNGSFDVTSSADEVSLKVSKMCRGSSILVVLCRLSYKMQFFVPPPPPHQGERLDAAG
jgi:hypothetical protein